MEGCGMAYIDTKPQNNRLAVIGTVAAIHGLMAYALITGLAANYYREVTTILEARNIPIDQPKPPPPIPQPSTDRQPERTIDRVPQVDPKFTFDTDIFVPEPPVDDRLTTRIAVFTPPLPPPTPGFVPRSVRPSNDRAGWATTNDYPSRDLREGNQGTTGFKLVIGTDGRVGSCVITRSSGFAGLDDATCRNVSRRARFDPATDGAGKPVAGEYSNNIRWVIPE